MRLQVLTVDDEPLARRRLMRLLKDDVDIESVTACASGREALAAVQAKVPDLIFLDVKMPGLDGFGFLGSLDREQLPVIIFVTAFDEYALRAFQVNAFDYLLKPFDQQRFADTLSRAKKRIRSDKGSELSDRLLSLLQDLKPAKEVTPPKNMLGGHLLIKENDRAFFLKTEDIDWVRADGKYVRIQVGKTSYLLRESIGKLEARLGQHRFLRVHRSVIVNIECVKEMLEMFHGEYEIVLRDGTRLPLSRRYRHKLRGLMGNAL